MTDSRTTRRDGAGTHLAAILLVIALSGTATAADRFRWQQGVWRDGIAGAGGNESRSATAPADKALVGFTSREQADDPVTLEVNVRTLCADQTSCPGPSRQVTLRAGDGGTLPSQKSAYVGDGLYIGAVQVCLSGQNNTTGQKIKGIRVWGITVRANGTTSPLPANPASFHRPNCSTWPPRVACPANQVAVGISAQYRSQRGFTGLRLQCAPLVAIGGSASGGGSGPSIQPAGRVKAP